MTKALAKAQARHDLTAESIAKWIKRNPIDQGAYLALAASAISRRTAPVKGPGSKLASAVIFSEQDLPTDQTPDAPLALRQMAKVKLGTPETPKNKTKAPLALRQMAQPPVKEDEPETPEAPAEPEPVVITDDAKTVTVKPIYENPPPFPHTQNPPMVKFIGELLEGEPTLAYSDIITKTSTLRFERMRVTDKDRHRTEVNAFIGDTYIGCFSWEFDMGWDDAEKLDHPFWNVRSNSSKKVMRQPWRPSESLRKALGITTAWRLLVDSQKDARSRFLAIKAFALSAGTGENAQERLDGVVVAGYRYDAEADTYTKLGEAEATKTVVTPEAAAGE